MTVGLLLYTPAETTAACVANIRGKQVSEQCVICQKATYAGYLCLPHYQRLARILLDIEDETVALDPVPSMAIRSGSGGGSLKSERAPARLSVLAYLDSRTRRWEPSFDKSYIPPAPKSYGPWCLFCEHETCMAWRAGRRRDLHDDEHDAGSMVLASILDELHNWARLVREERDLTTPQHITISGERDLLSRQISWIADQPWVDEMYADLRKLLGSLQSVNQTQPEKPIGRCYLPTDVGVCDGPIWMDYIEAQAHCGRCKRTWDGPQLAMLNFELEQIKAEKARPRTPDGRRMLTAQELADASGTSVNAIRLRLSRAGAKAVNGHYDPEWLARKDKATA